MTKEKTDFLQPILLTAKSEVDLLGTESNEFLNRLRNLAVALCGFHQVDTDSEMENYDRELNEFIASGKSNKERVDKKSVGKMMREVLKLCETIKDKKKVIAYINTAYAILEINEFQYAA